MIDDAREKARQIWKMNGYRCFIKLVGENQHE